MIGALFVAALATACNPSEITQAEAKALVIQAETMQAKGVKLDAKLSQTTGRPDSWTFRVFAPEATSPSNLMSWYGVNKRTAALTDPVLDRPIVIPGLRDVQKRLLKAHCSPSPAN